jgi:hypothetical protein
MASRGEAVRVGDYALVVADHRAPFDWMRINGIVGRVKLSSNESAYLVFDDLASPILIPYRYLVKVQGNGEGCENVEDGLPDKVVDDLLRCYPIPYQVAEGNTLPERLLVALGRSISLTKEEKLKVLNRLPALSQFKLDDLMRIFNEESAKFAKMCQPAEAFGRRFEIRHKCQQHLREFVELVFELRAESNAQPTLGNNP